MVMALHVVREDLEDVLGEPNFHALVVRFGERSAEGVVHAAFEAGQLDATEEGFRRALEFLGDRGYGHVQVVEHDWSEGWLLVESPDSAEAHVQFERDGPGLRPRCDILRGWLCGVYRYVRRRAGKEAEELAPVETSCAGQGNPVCRIAVGSRRVLEAHGIEAPATPLTSRAELEESLRTALDSEGKLRAFVEEMPFGVVTLDTKGYVTFANRKALDIVALPFRKLAGSHFSEHIHPDDVEIAMQGFRKVVEGRADRYPATCRMLNSSGTVRQCSVDAFPMSNAKGVVVGYQATVVDLSEFGRAGKRAQRLHLALRESPWPCMELEPEGRIRHVNGAAARLLAERPEALVGVPFMRILAEGQSSSAYQSFLEVASGHKPYAAGKWEIRGEGAAPHAVTVRFFPEGMQVGRIEGVLAFLEEHRGEEWYRAIIESGASVYTVVDARGRTVYKSPSLTRVFGWLPEELVGKSVFELVHPEDRPLAKAMFGELLAEPGVLKAVELRYRHKDGTWLTIKVSAVNLLHNPAIEGIVMSSLDVTDRSKAENALRESGELFAAFIRDSANAYVELDLEGNLTFANARTSALSGHTTEELCRMHMSQLLLPEDLDRAYADLKLALTDPNAGPREYRYRHKDGTVLCGEMNTLPMMMGGQPVGFRVTIADVSARVWAEKALEETQQKHDALNAKAKSFRARHEALMIGTHSLIYETDSDGLLRNIDGDIDGILGFTREDIKGLPFPPYVHADDLAATAGLLRRAAGRDGAEPASGSLEVRLRKRDGTWRAFAMTAMPVAGEGEDAAAIIGFMHDVTEQSDTAKRLAQQDRLCEGLMASESAWVVIADGSFRVQKLSHAYEKSTGFEVASRTGKPLAALVAPGGDEVLDRLVKAGEGGGTGPRVRLPFLKVEGTDPCIVELEPTLLRDDEGRFVGLVAVGFDVTGEGEREAAEVERHELAQQLTELRSEVQGRYGLDNIIGRDPKMRAIYETILAVSRTQATVLIQGDTGTGKELVAKAIHYNSPRRDRPFIKVDCGALAETLLESELFGHVKGAFTGAVRDRPGRFELADSGTIFLDEVHNLSIPLQAKLLRVVQEGAFEKVGGTKTQTVDVRIVAATNEDLEAMVARNRFRKDLYYRLNVIPVRLPALRDRRGDIPLLVSSFIGRFAERHGRDVAGASRAALDRLVEYDWPGNVRELENIVEQAVVFCRGGTVGTSDIRLPEPSRDPLGGQGRPAKTLREALEDPEKRIVLEALARTGGNKKRAAALLGISRSAFYEKLKKHRLKPSRGGK
jgi:PAS domain S-box-containing protein